MPQARDLDRFLQQPTPRERAVRRLPQYAAVPGRVGPVEFERFGAKWIAVRCASEFDELMRSTCGLREAGSHRWLIPRHRVGPLVRELRRAPDPLFRRRGSTWTGKATDERPALASGALMDPSTVPWIGGAIVGGVLLMLLAWSGFHLESRRRHVPVLQDPGQIRRDNAIVLGVCLLMIVMGLLAGTGWCGGCCRDPHRHLGLPLQAAIEEAEGGRDRRAGERPRPACVVQLREGRHKWRTTNKPATSCQMISTSGVVGSTTGARENKSTG